MNQKQNYMTQKSNSWMNKLLMPNYPCEFGDILDDYHKNTTTPCFESYLQNIMEFLERIQDIKNGADAFVDNQNLVFVYMDKAEPREKRRYQQVTVKPMMKTRNELTS